MTDRHKSHPLTVRAPDGLRVWLADYAAVTGQTVHAVHLAALEEFAARHLDVTIALAKRRCDDAGSAR